MKRFLSLSIAGFALASSLTFVSATSASAHDEILSTTPSADSQVAPGQLKVAVTFNEPVMDAGDGAGLAIQVTGPDGGIVESQCLSISGTSLSAGIDASAAGDYSVDWRAVSSDGHANSGTFAFTVADGAEVGEAPAADASCLNVAAEATPMPLGAEAPEEPTLTSVDPADETMVEGTLTPETFKPVSAGGAEGQNQPLDPLVGLGIGIALFVGLSLIGIAVFELQKRARLRAAQAKKEIEEQ
jgi:hypothetical protein